MTFGLFGGDVPRLYKLTYEGLIACYLSGLPASNHVSTAISDLSKVGSRAVEARRSECSTHPRALGTLEAHLIDVKICKLDRETKPLVKRELRISRAGLKLEHPVPHAFDRQPTCHFSGKRTAHPVGDCYQRAVMTLSKTGEVSRRLTVIYIGLPGICGR